MGETDKMKPKLTKKDITNSGKKVLRVRDDALRNLLINHEPIGYNAGTYGFNWDAYEVCGVVICSGFRNMPGVVPYGAIIYEEQAQKVVKDYSKSWDERREEVEELLRRFCAENGGKAL